MDIKKALRAKDPEIFSGADYDCGELEALKAGQEKQAKFLINLAAELTVLDVIKEKRMIQLLSDLRYPW